MKREAWDHPKFKLVARDLRLPMYAVRGLVESIWLIAGLNFRNGLIRWSDEELAVAIDYPEDAETMVNALVARKLLDRMEGGLYVHDWHEHADDAVHMHLARHTLRFANGSLPSLGRLSKDQRQKALAKYGECAHEEPEQVQSGDSVRTDSDSVRTYAQKGALPEPEPEPVNTEPTVLISSPGSPSSSEAGSPAERHDLARRTLVALHRILGKPKPPREEDVHKLAVPNRGLIPLARDVGPERAAELYDYAIRTYGVHKGWPFANEKRDELAREMAEGRSFAPRAVSPPGTSLPARADRPSAHDQTRGALQLLQQKAS